MANLCLEMLTDISYWHNTEKYTNGFNGQILLCM